MNIVLECISDHSIIECSVIDHSSDGGHGPFFIAFGVFCLCKSCNKYFFGLNKVIAGFFLTKKLFS